MKLGGGGGVYCPLPLDDYAFFDFLEKVVDSEATEKKRQAVENRQERAVKRQRKEVVAQAIKMSYQEPQQPALPRYCETGIQTNFPDGK